MEKATFGAGCFWCVEACFSELKGVKKVIPGYSGGEEDTANYKDVCTGETGHVEVVRIEYDENEISYDDLLEVFWFVHDPTQLNRQGNDVGTQYRSVIFYHNDEQQKKAEFYKRQLEEAKAFEDPVVTAIEPLKNFFPAEDYHLNYLKNNPENPYCQTVVRPKYQKFKSAFRKKLK